MIIKIVHNTIKKILSTIFIKKIFIIFVFPILKVICYPYELLFIYFFQEKKIYELIYKNHFTSSTKSKFNLNKYLFGLNYYYFPIKIQKKLIASSMGNPIEAVGWAKIYRKRGFPDKHTENDLAFNYLFNYIEQKKDKKICIHQVCASSGRVIHHFSKYSDQIIFEASDLSEELAKDIKSNYKNLNSYCINLSDQNQLKYVTSRADLIFAFGGLQYLLPNDVKNFFKYCKEKETELIMSEPFDSRLSPFSLKNSVPRGNFSWSHPYLFLANKFNFKVKNASTSFIQEQPWSQTFSAHFQI